MGRVRCNVATHSALEAPNVCPTRQVSPAPIADVDGVTVVQTNAVSTATRRVGTDSVRKCLRQLRIWASFLYDECIMRGWCSSFSRF